MYVHAAYMLRCKSQSRNTPASGADMYIWALYCWYMTQSTSGKSRHLVALATGLLRLVDEEVVCGRQRAHRPEGVLGAREEAKAAAAD